MEASTAFYVVSIIITIITTTSTSRLVTAQLTELAYVLPEERPAMTFVGNVLVDSNIRALVSPRDISDLRFSFLTERNPHVSLMGINSTSGELRTSCRINRETICPKLTLCELRLQTVVQAQLGSFFKIIQLKVTITDINDNEPLFNPSVYQIQILESAAPGTFFRLPTAIDLDSDPENYVSEYNQVGTLAPFALFVNRTDSSFDVRITLESGLDREIVSFYQIFIRAVDGGLTRLTGTLTVNLEVVDVNDNSPVFLQQEYSANISDSLAVGSVVVVVKATDMDAGDNGLVTYHLASVQDDPIVFQMFEANGSTGEVKSKVALDSYAGRNYRLTIEAQDSASNFKTCRTGVVISVVDIDNSQPEILLNVFGAGGIARVSELAELGRVVAHLAVTDPDSNQTSNGLVSCLVYHDDHFQLQAMDTRQFKVVLTRRLDREQQAFHSVTILCEDSGTPALNASSSFTVAVEDENDNAPEFISPYYTVEVVEGRNGYSGDMSTVILTVTASDRDIGPNAQITYRLADGADSDFGLYADGSVVVTNPVGLDREDAVRGGTRHLVIRAVDRGKPELTGTTTVTVIIHDVNDNAPKFLEPIYFFQVEENFSPNQIINNVSAIDLDLGINGTFFFKMHPNYIRKFPFEVSTTGSVKLSGDIDREDTPSYQFYIVATDMGNPQMSSTVEVRIQITDVNDNFPEFVFPRKDNYTIYIPHTLEVDTVFTRIIAKDMDAGRNSQLVYLNKDGNSSKYFDVRSNSGDIVLLQDLTSEEIGLHILFVSVHDRGLDAQLTSKSILHIVVYEGNVTVSTQDYHVGARNVIISVVLVVITTSLALTIFVTIFLIRRVDKQRRFYSTAAEESRIESKLNQINPYLTTDLVSLHPTLDAKDMTTDGQKRKKEVSFVLKDNITNNTSTFWATSPAGLGQYGSVAGRQEEIMESADPDTDHDPHDDDNSSDSSSNLRPCDSGKGDSDLEAPSVTGVFRDSCESTVTSQYGLDHSRNNCVKSSTLHNTRRYNDGNTNKTGLFQKSKHDLLQKDITHTPTSCWLRPPFYPDIPHNKSGLSISKYNRRGISPENEIFVNMKGGRLTRLSNQGSGNNNSFIMTDVNLANQNNCFMESTNQKIGDKLMPEDVCKQSFHSSSYLDASEAWEGDTTTSGSYTIDPRDLSDATDTFFFGSNRDIVV